MCGIRPANLTLLNFTTTTKRGLRAGAWALNLVTHILWVWAENGPGLNETNQTLHKTSRVFSIHYFRKN
jgi:hypothetical protein